MTEYDPSALAEAIARQRRAKFGTKRSAYNAAGVNAATWDKAEAGDPSIRGDLLWSIVRVLWPETNGDPVRVPTVGGVTQDHPGYVESPGETVESGITNEDLLREILRSRAEYDQLRAEVRDLSQRVARVEQSDA